MKQLVNMFVCMFAGHKAFIPAFKLLPKEFAWLELESQNKMLATVRSCERCHLLYYHE